ncbi:MAG: hypothetical protein V3T76_09805 [candidate division NC10 bacterium]
MAYNEYHASFAEIFQRYLHGRLDRYMRLNHTNNYVKVLPDFIASYNAAEHSTTHVSPVSVSESNQQDLYERVYMPMEVEDERARRDYVFAKGDKVRLSRATEAFYKGFKEKWSTEVFEVMHAVPSNPPRYIVQDLLGERLKGSFYAEEMQKTDYDPEGVFTVDEVLGYRKRKGHEREALVSWYRWPSKFNSYIRAADLESFT